MKKILVAEDESTTRKVIVHTLENAGFDVISATNGLSALTLLHDNPDFDLIVTDMQMPQMNGREFLDKAALDRSSKNIPVIIVSGVITLDQISDLLKNGATKVMPKPLHMNDLVTYARNLTK